jgi:hypothetical protein
MPGTVFDQRGLELTDRGGDTPFHDSLCGVSRNAYLSESWHSVHRIGRTEGGTSPRGKADMRHMTGLALAGHLVMLRF